MQQIKVSPIVHKGNKRLLVQFNYDLKLISIINFTLANKRWNV